MIKEKCQNCKGKIEPIVDKEGFIINWYCGKCSLFWDLNDLKVKKIQKKLI